MTEYAQSPREAVQELSAKSALQAYGNDDAVKRLSSWKLGDPRVNSGRVNQFVT